MAPARRRNRRSRRLPSRRRPSGGCRPRSAAAPAATKTRRPAPPAPPPPALPLLRFPAAAAAYLAAAAEVEAAARRVLAAGVGAVGFDVEWLVTFAAGVPPRPVALVQLCYRAPRGGRYHCLLLHVAHAGVPPALRALLEAGAPLKVGAGAHTDSLKVHRDFGIQMGGVCDLSAHANERLCAGGGGAAPRWSLAALAEKMLRRRLPKGADLRCSDWERRPLLPEQIEYAATDAYASLRVFEALAPLPVVARAPPPAPPPAAATPGATPPGAVPALPRLAALQPAKLSVWRLFAGDGLAPEAIAAQRGIQLDSVQAYLAEALLAGHPYGAREWRRLGVPRAAVRAAAGVCAEVLGEAWRGGAAAGEGGEGGCRDLLPELLAATGEGIRELRERQFGGAWGFGVLCVALAHVARVAAAGGAAAEAGAWGDGV